MMNKKMFSLLIWILAFAALLVVAYVFYSNNKAGNLITPPQSTNDQQKTVNPNNKVDEVPSETEAAADSTKSESDKVMAPDFALNDMDGNSIKLSDYKDKIVVLNFWAVWCKYCIKEMPDLDKLNKELNDEGDGVVLAVNVQESKETVQKYLDSNDFDIKVVLDENGTVVDTYGVDGFPTTFLVNKDGSVYAYIPGLTDIDTLRTLIDKMRNGEPLN